MVKTLEQLGKYRVILASGSPRRRELLSGLGITFTVKKPLGTDEGYPAGMPVVEVPQYVSRKKAEACRAGMLASDLVITADTVVALGRRILGKPEGEAEARGMLKSLSGRTHRVITGVTVMTAARTETFAAVSRVRFASLSEDEINYYVSEYRPFDKAGAYGIQEWIGMTGVAELSGSYFNVMGLPVQQLYERLKTF